LKLNRSARKKNIHPKDFGMYNIILLISIIENGFFDKFFSPEILGESIYKFTFSKPVPGMQRG